MIDRSSVESVDNITLILTIVAIQTKMASNLNKVCLKEKPTTQKRTMAMLYYGVSLLNKAKMLSM